jgi:hypothetical protein
MGLIKALSGAAGGALTDQWRYTYDQSSEPSIFHGGPGKGGKY